MRISNLVSETTTSIAGTSGNGAVTLTARSGLPRFSTVFGAGAAAVKYVIRKTDGSMFESGFGTVASNVLTRSRPETTWDGTTYLDAQPSPLQFGSSPASGVLLIEMAMTAEMAGAGMLQGIQTTLAADGNWREYQMSRHLNWLSGGSSYSFSANTEIYQIHDHPVSGLCSGFQVEVATSQAASGLKVALYSLNENHLPGKIITSFPVIDTTTTGFKTITTGFTPFRLSRGPLYAIGLLANAAIGIRRSNSSQLVGSHRGPWGRKDNYGQADGISRSGSYATGLVADPSFTGATTLRDTNMFIGLLVQP